MKRKILFPLMMCLPFLAACQTNKNNVDLTNDTVRGEFAGKLATALQDNSTKILEGVRINDKMNIESFELSSKENDKLGFAASIKNFSMKTEIGVGKIEQQKLPDLSLRINDLKGDFSVEVPESKYAYNLKDALALGVFYKDSTLYVDASNENVSKVAVDVLKMMDKSFDDATATQAVAAILGEGLLKVDVSSFIKDITIPTLPIETIKGIDKATVDSFLVSYASFVECNNYTDGGFGFKVNITKDSLKKLLPEAATKTVEPFNKLDVKLGVDFTKDGLLSKITLKADLDGKETLTDSGITTSTEGKLKCDYELSVDYTKGANLPSNLADYQMFELPQF